LLEETTTSYTLVGFYRDAIVQISLYVPWLARRLVSRSPFSYCPSTIRRGPRPAALRTIRGCLSFSILIVDDSVVVRRTLRSRFENNVDWKVCGEAVDGQEAVEKARELHPDLIILDLSMPRMNGLEAARELKRIQPDVLLFMFTTFKTRQVEAEAMEAGCSAVIAKSDVKLLFESIQRMARL
jgi:CheY-like chemotaxis protein